MSTQPLKAFEFRHACKVMDANRKIPADTFNTILEAGRLSPSSFGYEPWRFLVVQNPELRDKLKAISWGAQNTLPQSSHFVVILARTAKTTRHDADYIQHMMKNIHHLSAESIAGRNQYYANFQRNDFDLLHSDRAMLDWAGKQTYIALANMMNVAAQLEVDSCPIEGFKQAEMNALLASDFGVDTSEFQASVMVAFGYRVNPQPTKTRQPMADVCQWFE